MSGDRRRQALTAAGATAMLAVGIGLGAGLYAALAPASTTTVLNAGAAGGAGAAGAPESITDLYQRSYRGVVEIIVNEGPAGSGPSDGRSTQAQGSGFVYDRRGDVVTNDHVVLGATAITVKLWAGQSFKGRLVGADESTDLAVVHIAAPAALLHPLALGDSGALAVGDPVVAIGSPFDLPETVTSGIVSALHRDISSPNNFTIGDAIQTDAAINHGNSGGPLLDASGRVVGINAQIQSESNGNEGIAFAIPSNTVRAIVPQLIAHRAVLHAYLGVQVVDSTSTPGTQISKVLPHTPAARAGLRKGDVITALAGLAVTDESDLAAALADERPGETVTLRFRRAGRTHAVRLTLATRPS